VRPARDGRPLVATHRQEVLSEARQYIKFRRAAQRKLQYLNAAVRLRDLAVPPGNRIEALKGDRRGFHSIRINDQWRIIFNWKDDDVTGVAVTDYH
jgi:proteic killer suppression protein